MRNPVKVAQACANALPHQELKRIMQKRAFPLNYYASFGSLTHFLCRFSFSQKNNYRIILYVYHYFYCSFFYEGGGASKLNLFTREGTGVALPLHPSPRLTEPAVRKVFTPKFTWFASAPDCYGNAGELVQTKICFFSRIVRPILLATPDERKCDNRAKSNR